MTEQTDLEPKKDLFLWLPLDLHTRIRELALADDMTIRELVTGILKAYVEGKNAKKKGKEKDGAKA